jgi:hypothetical protein
LRIGAHRSDVTSPGDGIPSFPELTLSRRPELFDALITHRFSDAVVQARFGDRPAWVVVDPAIARGLLRRRDLAKGRSAVSREAVGGYPARTGAGFHRGRSDVVVALARSAGDPAAMSDSLRATVGSTPPARDVAAAAFTRWMLNDLIGGDPVDLTVLDAGIAAMEDSAEAAQTGGLPSVATDHARSALAFALAERVEASRSAFIDELRKRGRSTAEVVEELIGLALAGWESTAAAVTTALTLGLHTEPSEAELSELLRLYPPSWLIVRELAGGEQWGSAGDLAVVSPWLSHRSDAWREPDTFDPERTDDVAALPFGAGPRRCPADLYARTQIAVALRVLGGGRAQRGRPVLLGHRSATLIPDMETAP